MLLDTRRPVVQHFAQFLKSELSRSRENRDTIDSEFFEFRVLEAILSFVSQKYQSRISCFHPLIDSLLKDLESSEMDPDPILLHRLLPIKNSLSALESSSTEIINAISAILHNDEDMLQMFLTEKNKRDGQLPPAYLHEELELLLENYHREISTIAQEATHFRKTIQSSQDMMNITLDTYRNRMIGINVKMGVAGIGLAASTVVAGVFGMNLISGLENWNMSFHIVTAGCIGTGAIFYYFCYKWASDNKKRSAVSEFTSIQPILSHLGDIQDIVLRGMNRSELWSKDEFLQLLQKASDYPLSGKDIGMIYRVFDMDKDGQLTQDDIKRFLAQQHSTQFRTFID